MALILLFSIVAITTIFIIMEVFYDTGVANYKSGRAKTVLLVVLSILMSLEIIVGHYTGSSTIKDVVVPEYGRTIRVKITTYPEWVGLPNDIELLNDRSVGLLKIKDSQQ